jgi:hypothetical protein
MLKNEILFTFEKEGVCFPITKVERFAKRLGLDPETFIECFDGMKFGEQNGFDFHELMAIDNDGNTQTVVAMGINPENFSRFLREDEQTFTEFYESHPRFPEVGHGQLFNEGLFDSIVAEHKQRLMG